MSGADGGRGGSGSPEVFACAPAARHAPGVVAAAMVLAGLIAAWRIEPFGLLTGVAMVRGLFVAVGAVAGLRFLLSAREVRIRAALRDDGLLLELGARAVAIPYGAVESLDYEHAFRRYTRWTPALVVVDVRGQRHRIPACIEDGERLVRGLVERASRRDLGIWADALGLPARMRRARRLAAAAYLCAVAIVVAAILA